MSTSSRIGVIRTLLFAAAAAASLSSVPARAASDGLAAYFGLLLKPACDRFAPGFEEATAKTFPLWKEQHQAAIAQLEADPEFLAKRSEALAAPAPDAASAGAKELTNMCDGLVETYESAGPGDPRFKSPEDTWKVFRNALRAGDRDTLRACLVAHAREGLLSSFEAMTDEQLKAMEASLKEMQLTTRYEPFQEAVVVRSDGIAGFVTFVKVGANWKISEM